MTTVYLSIGTNIGEKEKHLKDAIRKINMQIGTVVSQSAFYVTEPWGFKSCNEFLNGALKVETKLTAEGVLEKTQDIEKEMGRTEKSNNGIYKDRIIDIDILLYGNKTVENEKLTIPHKLMLERMFVMEPLAEIAPNIIIPGMNVSVIDALEDLKQKLQNRDED